MGRRKQANLDAGAKAVSALPSKSPDVGRLAAQEASTELPQETSTTDEKHDELGAQQIDTVGTRTSASNWYGGSWAGASKTAPITAVAKDTYTATGGVASGALASVRDLGQNASLSPTASLKALTGYQSRGIELSGRPLSVPAVAIQSDITSCECDPNLLTGRETRNSKSTRLEEDSRSGSLCVAGKAHDLDRKRQSPKPPLSSREERISEEKPPANRNSANWRTWFSKEESPCIETAENNFSNSAPGDVVHVSTGSVEDAKVGHSDSSLVQDLEVDILASDSEQNSQLRSWMSFWGAAGAIQKTSSRNIDKEQAPKALDTPKESMIAKEKPKAAHLAPQPAFQARTISARSSRTTGWSFWPKDNSVDRSGYQLSSTCPIERATASEPPQAVLEDTVLPASPRTNNQAGESQRELSATGEVNKSQDPKSTTSKFFAEEDPRKDVFQARAKSKGEGKNLLLPSFEDTYRSAGEPGLVHRLGRLLHLQQASESKQVFLDSHRPRIKSALAIGVHGYFPAPLIRSVLGQPTGTSVRFANNAASAIEKWSLSRGFTCKTEKIALEGEGKIAERIDILWKLLLGWIETIQRADFVMIACHSQGVPVTMMLVARLIGLGCVNTAKIGVCAMAGINLGPFGDYKSRWISGSAGELFDFAQPHNQVSKDYQAALDIALRFGVKVTYVGSIDDQLVSLESSTFGTVVHPHIYRAVFVDGRVHAPDFLSHLVGFALKLRNLGITDHGLIRELSAPLAGSLYGGEGHSRIYEDACVYDLAVQYALETTSLDSIPLQMLHIVSTPSPNPYILPFAMRGVIEEDYVRTELYSELMELIKQFDSWQPSSKVLKDVKFRLEGVRTKL